MRKIFDLNCEMNFNEMTWLVPLICGGRGECPMTRPRSGDVTYGIRTYVGNDWVWSRTIPSDHYFPQLAVNEILENAIKLAGEDVYIDESTNILYDTGEDLEQEVDEDIVHEIRFEVRTPIDDCFNSHGIIIQRGWGDTWEWMIGAGRARGREERLEDARKAAVDMAASLTAAAKRFGIYF